MSTRQKLGEGVRNPLEAARFVFGRVRHRIAVRRAGGQRAYYEQYVDQSFEGVGEPAIGHEGQFERMGRWQFDTLREAGLSQRDYLLDVGCGPLRGGRLFVDFLDRDRYVGMDISAAAIRAGRQRVRDEELLSKRPTLIQNTDLRFAEPELYGRRFDVVLAQSLITHLDWEQTTELFEHLSSVLAFDGQFIATFFEDRAGYAMNHNGRTFRYSKDELRELARVNDLEWHHYQPDEPHPNGHELMRVTHR